MGIIDSLISRNADQAPQAFDLVGPDGKPLRVTADQLAAMDWGTLQALREKNQTPELQAALAPYEHRAYARETAKESPGMGIIMPAMAAGYQAKKVGEEALGVPRGPKDTPPSMTQLKQGIIGAAEGLGQAYQQWRGGSR